MELATKFIEDVNSGALLSCEYVQLAVNRHLSDLSMGDDFPFYFDEELADRTIKIFKLFRHTKGDFARKHFDLQPYQAFIVAMLFGWLRKDTGKRRFTKAYVEIARKAGKSEFAAAICLFGLLFDGEFGAEVYTAATKRDQAKIVFEAAKTMGNMLRQDSRTVKDDLGIYAFNLHNLKTRSKLEPLGADSDTLDGLNPHIAVVDEYHAHKDSKVLKVLETGMGSRSQPLLFVITTAGFNKQGPCYQYRKVCTDILRGNLQDESTFAVIFTLDEADDWQDESVWVKANPNLGKTPKLEYMKSAKVKALNEGSTAEVEFKTKNLNVWTDTADVWIPDATWVETSTAFDLKQLEGRPCFGGLDLASTRDICALSLYFPPYDDDDKGIFVNHYWIPGDNVDKRSQRDQVPYRQWVDAGYITSTDGNVTDYNYIKSKVMDLHDVFKIQSIAYDRYNASQLVIDLTDEGVKMSPFGQGFISMSAPTKEFEKLVLGGKITAGEDPVLRWMLGNVQTKIDPAGNIKVDKGNSREKVDGVVACIMALGEAMTFEKIGPSVYEKQEIRYL